MAGFSWAYVLPIAEKEAPTGRYWSVLFLGVAERFRRQGIATALLQRAREILAGPGAARPVVELMLSAWQPHDVARAFATRHGFRHARTFWLMERPLGAVAGPAWPEGVMLRTYDGSEAALRDLTGIYNDSFAEHYHFIPEDEEGMRNLLESDLFRADGIGLAYRGDDCLGFCRSWLWPGRGEIAMLGTSRRARGIGLGRALLRWGVRWLEAQGTPRVTLMVDGENESALKLYRQEGFEVARTRDMWSLIP